MMYRYSGDARSSFTLIAYDGWTTWKIFKIFFLSKKSEYRSFKVERVSLHLLLILRNENHFGKLPLVEMSKSRWLPVDLPKSILQEISPSKNFLAVRRSECAPFPSSQTVKLDAASRGLTKVTRSLESCKNFVKIIVESCLLPESTRQLLDLDRQFCRQSSLSSLRLRGCLQDPSKIQAVGREPSDPHQILLFHLLHL